MTGRCQRAAVGDPVWRLRTYGRDTYTVRDACTGYVQGLRGGIGPAILSPNARPRTRQEPTMVKFEAMASVSLTSISRLCACVVVAHADALTPGQRIFGHTT